MTFPWDRAFHWIFDPPRETLRKGLVNSLSPALTLALVLGSLLSLAFAEALSVGASWGPCALSFGSSVISLVLWTLIFFELSKIFNKQMAPWPDWVYAAALSLLPLNLLLPVGLFVSNHGVLGLLSYEVAKALVLLSVVKRAISALEILNGWPTWGALALIAAPLVIGGLALLLLLGAGVLLSFLLLMGLSH